METKEYTALELARAVKEKRTTVIETVERIFGCIAEKEKRYHCYVTADKEKALKQAEDVQRKIEKGILTGPLAGVPAAVKDNICTEGMRTTCCSKILGNFVPSYSAQAVEALKESGVIIIGKTNMDEFAMGSTTETSAFGATKNPWDQTRVPGGSSGGSAAAVAAGECVFALGSDTGGSIRQPASFCGVVGMKPTYGAISRYGLIAYASSLDQIGPLTRDVSDCAAVLETLSSYDPRDATCVKRKDTDFMSALKPGLKGMKIGIPAGYFGKGLDGQVRRAVLDAAEVLRDSGASVEEFDLALIQYAVPDYYTLACAEASSNLARFDGVKYGQRAAEYEGLHGMYKNSRSEGFGEEVKRRIMLGCFVLSSGYYEAYYLKALQVRSLMKRAFDEAFEKYDMILGPVSPHTAPRLGESLHDPLQMYLGDIYTISANLAGLPAVSVPCGFDSAGLPIGMQLTANCFEEKKLIRAAYTYEQAKGGFRMAYEAGEQEGVYGETV